MCYRTAGLPVPAVLEPPPLPQLRMFPLAPLLGLVYVSYIWGCFPIGWALGLYCRGRLWLVPSDFHVFAGIWETGRGDARASGTPGAGQGTGGAHQPPGGTAGPHGEWGYIGPPGTCSRHCLLRTPSHLASVARSQQAVCCLVPLGQVMASLHLSTAWGPGWKHHLAFGRFLYQGKLPSTSRDHLLDLPSPLPPPQRKQQRWFYIFILNKMLFLKPGLTCCCGGLGCTRKGNCKLYVESSSCVLEFHHAEKLRQKGCERWVSG